MGFFDLFSGKDDTPPAPEKRAIPPSAEGIKNPLEGWVVTQVFVDNEKRKSDRVYYAARLDGDTWDILKCTYSVTERGPYCWVKRIAYKGSADEAIEVIAKIEKALLQEGYKPIPSLRGNYIEAANLNGGYINDKGEYVPVAKNELLDKDMTFTRKGISAMYSKAAEKPAGTEIKTWDDYYREIVRPSEVLALSEKEQQNPKLEKLLGCIGDVLAMMHVLDGKMTVRAERQYLEKAARSFDAGDFYRLGAEISQSDGEYDEDGGTPKIVYDYEVARLTSMMRLGATLYQKLTASLSIDEDELKLLTHINQTLPVLAEERLYCSPEQARQLANVIMTGLDPYADKPLPLEVFYKRYMDQLSSPKKNTPKPPSVE